MRPSAIIAILIAVLLAMPLDAFARAGKSGSLGSRGSRTYDRPIERSVTPPPAQATPGAQQPMYRPDTMGQRQMAPSPAAGANPGFFQRNPMMGGLLAGFVGAGLFGMLFNSSAMAGAGDAAPFASFFGTILQFALIGGLVWMVMRLLRRRSAATPAGSPEYQREAGYHREAAPSAVGAAASAAASVVPRTEKAFEPSAEDKDAFSAIILGVQEAWSAGDVGRLRTLATPEVVSWLAEDLSRDASQGRRNVVEDVVLLSGDVFESWRDGDLEFATAAITFSAKDYTMANDGRVVDGDAANPVEVSEAWTFVRAPGGGWLLSAIEQPPRS